MRHRAAGILTVLVVVGALMVAGAPAATAAAPRCTGVGFRVVVYPDGTWDSAMTVIFPAHSPQVPIWGGSGGAGYWSCSLVQTSKGSGVRRLQETMNYCYETPIRQALGGALLQLDGDFGSLTKRALIAVQRYHGIEDNGEYGPQTARTMRHFLHDGRYGYHGCVTLTEAGWPGNSG
jgi:peptidoglycan hydrolase-like protein with peptidoglycan-binding domain